VSATHQLKHLKSGDIIPVRFLAQCPEKVRYAKKGYLAFVELLIIALAAIVISFVLLYFALWS